MTTHIKLVCPSCATVNRFPGERIEADPKCGQCKKPLLQDAPIEVSADALSKHVKHSSIPVLVDFWAPWCGPCRGFAPVYSSYAGSHSTRIRCLKLDTEAHQRAGAAYGIRSIPTLALFQGGREVNRISGAMNGPQLQQWVDTALTQ